MPKALNRIEHGVLDKDGKNTVVILEAGEEAKGRLPADVIKQMQGVGAIEADAAPAKVAD